MTVPCDRLSGARYLPKVATYVHYQSWQLSIRLAENPFINAHKPVLVMEESVPA